MMGAVGRGAEGKDPTGAQMWMMHKRLITLGNEGTLRCGCLEKGLTHPLAHPEQQQLGPRRKPAI